MEWHILEDVIDSWLLNHPILLSFGLVMFGAVLGALVF